MAGGISSPEKKPQYLLQTLLYRKTDRHSILLTVQYCTRLSTTTTTTTRYVPKERCVSDICHRGLIIAQAHTQLHSEWMSNLPFLPFISHPLLPLILSLRFRFQGPIKQAVRAMTCENGPPTLPITYCWTTKDQCELLGKGGNVIPVGYSTSPTQS